MFRQSWFSLALCAGTALLLTGVLFLSAEGADKASTKPAPQATAPSRSIASGASEDSLTTCLGRIPKDSTVGQRLLAETSCKRDEYDRKPFQSTLNR
jgi:hypothetical protein